MLAKLQKKIPPALLLVFMPLGCDEAENDEEVPPLPIAVVEGDQPHVEDYEILGAVRGELWADEIIGRRIIGVDVHRGIVTLTGTVHSIAAKQRAVARAEAVPGVRAVIDRLEISRRPYVERRRAGGAVPTDELIEEAVRDAWRQDERLKAHELSVEVQNGVATLTGLADSAVAWKLAVQYALNTVGVVEVENRIALDSTRMANIELQEDRP